MRKHFFARHSETGVIHPASAETDAHPKMHPISLDEAEAAGFAVERFRALAAKQEKAPAEKPKNRGGRPRKAPEGAKELKPGQVLITGEHDPIPKAVDAADEDGGEENDE